LEIVLGLIAPRGFKSRILRQLAGQTLVALIGWAHETAAAKALRNGETQVAQVPAILALAFAVNRLAGAHYTAMEWPDHRDADPDALYRVEPGF
jgi:hypothetical protein